MRRTKTLKHYLIKSILSDAYVRSAAFSITMLKTHHLINSQIPRHELKYVLCHIESLIQLYF